ncbi:MAG TPA: hypothetical protein VKE98_08420 [Gemmataceae bacterium]|nr:hypothetical protein [Gemmataceae bacterium]
MLTSILSLALTLVPAQEKTPRPPHPLAPSIPLLSDKEYAEIDAIIERFIQYDVGKLKGADGRKALADFLALGHEAVFPLIDGFNRAANMEHSCPAVLIAKKLSRILGATQDVELLEYARENIGADVTAKRHINVVKDLRVSCMLRKTYVQRIQATASLPGQKPLRSMSIDQLVGAAEKEKGPQLKMVLGELERRTGPKVIDTLVMAIAKPEKDIRATAESLLVRHFSRMSAAALKTKLQDERPEVRAAVLIVAAGRKLAWGSEFIDLVPDTDNRVSQAARRALVQLARGTDFGPEVDSSPTERSAAATRWREWWSKRKQ